jgi:hypothetical protein
MEDIKINLVGNDEEIKTEEIFNDFDINHIPINNLPISYFPLNNNLLINDLHKKKVLEDDNHGFLIDGTTDAVFASSTLTFNFTSSTIQYKILVKKTIELNNTPNSILPGKFKLHKGVYTILHNIDGYNIIRKNDIDFKKQNYTDGTTIILTLKNVNDIKYMKKLSIVNGPVIDEIEKTPSINIEESSNIEIVDSIDNDPEYKLLYFNSTGILTLTSNIRCDILLVGGGGGGGWDGGGGGGGAVVELYDILLPSGTFNMRIGNGGGGISRETAQKTSITKRYDANYKIEAGAGGNGQDGADEYKTLSKDGIDGNSVYTSDRSSYSFTNKGAGGGGSKRAMSGNSERDGAGGNGTYEGGIDNIGNNQKICGAGGGGAGSKGGNSTEEKGGDGGNGKRSKITKEYYGGGGGGYFFLKIHGKGGIGGGGDGFYGGNGDSRGKKNTGGGGGGANPGNLQDEKRRGGSGVIIIKVKSVDIENTKIEPTFDNNPDYKLIYFRNSGTLKLKNYIKCDILLVGGGGAGGWAGGGGGGGGVYEVNDYILNSGTYTINIGAGGHGDYLQQNIYGVGGNTFISFNNKTILGAGGGGNGKGHGGVIGNNGQIITFNNISNSGGGGGGANENNDTPFSGNNISGDGGKKPSTTTERYSSGGGGGAGGNGKNGTNDKSGDGGIGKISKITGEEKYYGGGGGGAFIYKNPGNGGLGGGGRGAIIYDTGPFNIGDNGVSNTGGGGGGSYKSGGGGGCGGSGVVIFRFKKTDIETSITDNELILYNGDYDTRIINEINNELDKKKIEFNNNEKPYNYLAIYPLVILITIIWIFIFLFLLKFVHHYFISFYIYILLFIIIILLIFGSIWFLYTNNDIL